MKQSDNMNYYTIKNFEKYQYYHTRNITSWIKLYFSLLDDYGFSLLTWEQKYCYIGLLLLAGKLNNKIPADTTYICQRLGQNSNIKKHIEKLVELQFLTIKNNQCQDNVKTESAQCQDNVKTESRTDKIRLDKIRLDKIIPLGDELKLPENYKITNDIQRIVIGYKMIKGFAKEDQSWDKLNFRRCFKSARQLLDYFTDWKLAVTCLREKAAEFKQKNLDFTLETIVKHASDWLQQKKEQTRKGESQNVAEN